MTRSAAGLSARINATVPAGDRAFSRKPPQSETRALVDWQAAPLKAHDAQIMIAEIAESRIGLRPFLFGMKRERRVLGREGCAALFDASVVGEVRADRRDGDGGKGEACYDGDPEGPVFEESADHCGRPEFGGARNVFRNVHQAPKATVASSRRAPKPMMRYVGLMPFRKPV